MREQRFQISHPKVLRYTLTYSEGTGIQITLNGNISIHPHIQWGNVFYASFRPCRCDTPSHTVRERLSRIVWAVLLRYTLTYSEGTKNHAGFSNFYKIHPHIQWGNPIVYLDWNSVNDTPSHTVRELVSKRGALRASRYTLTYSEGTHRFAVLVDDRPIHPHIQWGNHDRNWRKLRNNDTPSHTVRELTFHWLLPPVLRYTLTYSEGTTSTSTGRTCRTIHPHIQWGNSLISI